MGESHLITELQRLGKETTVTISAARLALLLMEEREAERHG